MPTPRIAQQIVQQTRLQQTTSAQGVWIPGTITSVTGAINAQYQVQLDTNESVNATSVIDLPLAEGDRVWVVKAGTTARIVGGGA